MKKVLFTLGLGLLLVGVTQTGLTWADEEGIAVRGETAGSRELVVESAAKALVPQRRPLIQLAILLDTSGSMSGLIAQAKTQLWTIVNEFATARRDGQIPELQVALYEYGKSSLPSSEGYLRMIVPLSTDLDKVSEELFALKTNGGSEYCGWVIEEATNALNWSGAAGVFKVIFIAGNEPFTQGKVDYKKACKAAVGKGIIVNTIHCGSHANGVSGRWKHGAELADGKYMIIDHNRKAVYIEAPQDKEIARLGEELNKTYIAFGQEGKAGRARQAEQDRNAVSASPQSSVQRAVGKSSSLYRNYGWDLVDAVSEAKVKLEEVKEADLPKEMQKMTVAERRVYVNAKQKQRREIQQKIKELNKARTAYVTKEMKKRADKGEDTLEAVIIKSVREQVSKKNFKFVDSQDTAKEGTR